MPPGHLPGEVSQAGPAGRSLVARHRSRWRDCIFALSCECLRIPQSELVDVAREREEWGPLLKLLPLRPKPRKAVDNGWMDGWMDDPRVAQLFTNVIAQQEGQIR